MSRERQPEDNSTSQHLNPWERKYLPGVRNDLAAFREVKAQLRRMQNTSAPQGEAKGDTREPTSQLIELDKRNQDLSLQDHLVAILGFKINENRLGRVMDSVKGRKEWGSKRKKTVAFLLQQTVDSSVVDPKRQREAFSSMQIRENDDVTDMLRAIKNQILENKDELFGGKKGEEFIKKIKYILFLYKKGALETNNSSLLQLINFARLQYKAGNLSEEALNKIIDKLTNRDGKASEAEYVDTNSKPQEDKKGGGAVAPAMVTQDSIDKEACSSIVYRVNMMVSDRTIDIDNQPIPVDSRDYEWRDGFFRSLLDLHNVAKTLMGSKVREVIEPQTSTEAVNRFNKADLEFLLKSPTIRQLLLSVIEWVEEGKPIGDGRNTTDLKWGDVPPEGSTIFGSLIEDLKSSIEVNDDPNFTILLKYMGSDSDDASDKVREVFARAALNLLNLQHYFEASVIKGVQYGREREAKVELAFPAAYLPKLDPKLVNPSYLQTTYPALGILFDLLPQNVDPNQLSNLGRFARQRLYNRNPGLGIPDVLENTCKVVFLDMSPYQKKLFFGIKSRRTRMHEVGEIETYPGGNYSFKIPMPGPVPGFSPDVFTKEFLLPVLRGEKLVEDGLARLQNNVIDKFNESIRYTYGFLTHLHSSQEVRNMFAQGEIQHSNLSLTLMKITQDMSGYAKAIQKKTGIDLSTVKLSLLRAILANAAEHDIQGGVMVMKLRSASKLHAIRYQLINSGVTVSNYEDLLYSRLRWF